MRRAYCQDPRTAFRVFRGEAAIITPSSRKIHILNDTATEIWSLCGEGARTVDELVSSLAARYTASADEMTRDVAELVEELAALGALKRCDVEGRPDGETPG